MFALSARCNHVGSGFKFYMNMNMNRNYTKYGFGIFVIQLSTFLRGTNVDIVMIMTSVLELCW